MLEVQRSNRPRSKAPGGGRGSPTVIGSNLPGRAGFTMVELLVAVAVVGILAAMAMFKIGSYRDQTRLRQSAEQVHQILAWAKLQAEKSGDTVLIQIALPRVAVYRDLNGSGKWEASDRLLSVDSLHSTVKLLKPAAVPSAATSIPAASGLADGSGTCGVGVCCTAGAGTPAWTDGYVNFCARTSPQLAPLAEDGALYMASTNSGVMETWAIVMNRAVGVEPSFWTAGKAPASAGDWRKIR